MWHSQSLERMSGENIFPLLVYFIISFGVGVSKWIKYLGCRHHPRVGLPYKMDGGARRTLKGLKKLFWYLFGCSASKRVDSGSFSGTVLGTEPKRFNRRHLTIN